MAALSLCAHLRDFLIQSAAEGEYDTLYLTRLPALPTPPAPPFPSSLRHAITPSSAAAAPPIPPALRHSVAPSSAAAAPLAPASAAPALLHDAPAGDAPVNYGFVRPPGDKRAQLDALQTFMGACPRCAALVRNRTRLVFGCGSPDAEIMFVGEAPGQDEDQQGIPFVGRAGQLLMTIIEKGMSLSRDKVYIANILKCRPPNNREPQPDEVANCTPFLNVQLEIVQPRVIVALGAYAAHFLTGVTTPISRMRGEFHHYRGIPVMPTFHPAYLLRNYTPEHRRHVWDDMKKVLEFLNSHAAQ
ncbi:MAG: uracil-DNA glycosylase [bacterium]|nr:uracil-DNA glycosylase [bacterium]